MKSIVVSVMLLLGSILMTAQQREQLPYSLQPKIQSITFSSDSQSDYVFKDGRTDVPPSKCIVRKNATGLPIFDIEVFRAARSQYGVTMRWTTNEPVRKGDVLLARVSMRTLSARQESGESVVFFYFQDARPPHDKSFPDIRIHDKIHVPLSVFELRIGKCVVHLAVLFLYDGEHSQRLAQQSKFPGVYGELSGLGYEGKSPDTDNVPYVEKFLENGIVHRLVLARADFIPLDINLYPSGLVLKFDE